MLLAMLPLRFKNSILMGETEEGEKELTACKMELYVFTEPRTWYGFFSTVAN